MAAGFDEFMIRSRALSINNEEAVRYVLYLGDCETPSEKSRLSYCSSTMMFLESIDMKIRHIGIKDIERFKLIKQEVLSDSRLNDILSQAARFVTFCKNEGIPVSIREEDILNLRIPRKEVDEKNPPRVLSPDEIVRVRTALIGKQDIRKLLTFELIYGFGLRERDLSYFSFDKYNENDGTFVYNDRIFLLPGFLQNIISSAPEKSLAKHSTYAGKDIESYKYHITVAGELSGIKLKISDLSKTHEETSIKCPECGNSHPFEDQYWRLRETGTEDFRFCFPICNYCVKSAYEYE